ncbi:DnaA regulatory inactivator Hda [Methylobacillus flagellatus]|uniref:Regulatory inactivation of DnaA Hda protein n=1 Tax=Methylobacillus flagellatus (strain ATCC 51484 / DSM 6875 / VKM B-1610 / KT) TaxID=265072 RepID=Q1H4W2_METFK|nr:DnaA regulatory inactivator Hda [Methylobacillus flagellatus]ABE48475.1 regulatory inactivation of DnaA Hda protein [Methylobacillus flagellatus KT]
MKQLLLDIQPPAAPSLDNFVTGRNAEALFQLRRTVLEHDDARFIYLWGETGCGKTHLIQACNALASASGLDMICVDDVHLLSNDDQVALFDLYNQLRESGGRLIVSGLAAPSQMGLRDDLATRLAWGLSYQLHPLSDEEKTQALKNHAEARGMKLPDEVLDYCLRHLRRDMPSLIATIDALDEWSLISKRAVTLPLLKQLLQTST